MISFWILITAGFIFSAAALLHGLCGFGFSMISITVLSLFAEPKLAVPLTAVASAVNCIYLMWILRHNIIFKQLAALIVICILFVPVGVVCLKYLNRAIIIRILGSVIVTISLISLLKLEHLKVFASQWFKWFAGMVSGVMCGAFSMPGPPLVLYAYNCGWPVKNAMANLQLLFTLLCPVVLVLFISTGLLTFNLAGFGLAYSPLVVIFTFLGARLSRKTPTKHLKAIINVLLGILGTSLIIKG